jgi:hypothetical protein
MKFTVVPKSELVRTPTRIPIDQINRRRVAWKNDFEMRRLIHSVGANSVFTYPMNVRYWRMAAAIRRRVDLRGYRLQCWTDVEANQLVLFVRHKYRGARAARG